jgi:hypothetical protein
MISKKCPNNEYILSLSQNQDTSGLVIHAPWHFQTLHQNDRKTDIFGRSVRAIARHVTALDKYFTPDSRELAAKLGCNGTGRCSGVAMLKVPMVVCANTWCAHEQMCNATGWENA